MHLLIKTLVIPIEKDGMAEYIKTIAKIVKINEDDIRVVKTLSKAIDLRDQNQFYYKLSLVISVPDLFENPAAIPLYEEHQEPKKTQLPGREKPIVVGFGPAGMFAALELIEYGLKPLIFERGEKIEVRALDVQRFIREKILNPASNIQYGEGGAGSFSDGKLFSRRNNNTGYINKVLQTFIRFGAPAEIEYMAKPHLGTDVLCKIVRNIRNYILERGGEIHYRSQMTDIIITEERAVGIVVNDEREYLASTIFIASGHSARDTYQMMADRGIALEQRPLSVGLRIDHPVETINLLRYGNKYKDFPGLGAATYSINYTNRKIKKGVYTFCMCPGGEIVNASSEPGHFVVNGMSYSQRSSPYSNAALVVSCHPSDYPSADPLAGIEFQRAIEKKAYQAGRGTWQAPAQNLLDFLADRPSTTLNPNSFKMGVIPANMRDIMPAFIIRELLAAFAKWKAEVPLFISEQAILLGVETRTSSPVRVQRDEHYESINIKNIYPIGEGSGHTGGITSSAADGIRAVQKFAARQ
ncbi:NAD(P)/FAD-dependent oxidoreductase [Desulfotalea psychrophila]|uniref:FAD-dependent protein C-terminal domain-containing protein n=1 Tax=Desulfotalea psychrophila (strain LSv54 / DSM 12343) TaxID=177439 RepID=Q6AR37_DESPS|nr:hypothetical protein [Desulfotalea psychrophila]CAG35187.1 conserved hypothetical protein [Desulfotalea psychrophila LSv54]